MEKIKVSAQINSAIKKVWEYYTNPKHIVNWNFASDDWCCPKSTNDLRVGGKQVSRMEAKDGSFGFDFEVTYNEVKPEEKITYSMGSQIGEGRQAEVSFNSLGDKTKLEVIFDPETENPAEMQKEGWQLILNNFKKYTENN
ncbi:MAG: SRPBCC family protein [Sphingobacteriaceae bacterium]|nr:SRPBCC family protein [Sphingobacteriaceae bacterium]